ncbi:MAG: cysteine synthase A [Desulfovibrio sp.]
MNIASDMLELVGRTPLVRLNVLTEGLEAEVVVKLECFNPCGSVKDRPAQNMIAQAEKEGLLKPGSVIVEPTSGNTGIGLAFAAAVKGYKTIFTMPDSLSIERRNLLKGLGAELVLTPGKKGMSGAIAKAEEILADLEDGFMPQQFENCYNAQAHFETTGPEIWEDTDGQVDIFVAGVGTGGTITGVGGFLKSKNPDVHIVAVEPAKSPVISGGSPAPHGIQGIGAGFIPGVLNTSLIDEVIQMQDENALATAKKVITTEGILCGISSGSNVYAAIELAKRPENKGKRIVTIICDTGERYLSTPLFTE